MGCCTSANQNKDVINPQNRQRLSNQQQLQVSQTQKQEIPLKQKSQEEAELVGKQDIHISETEKYSESQDINEQVIENKKQSIKEEDELSQESNQQNQPENKVEGLTTLNRLIKYGKEKQRAQQHYDLQLREDCDQLFQKASSQQLTCEQIQEVSNIHQKQIEFILFFSNDIGLTLLEWILMSNQFDLFLTLFTQINIIEGDDLFQLQVRFFNKMKEYTRKSNEDILQFIQFIKQLGKIENTQKMLNYLHLIKDDQGNILETFQFEELFNLQSYFNFKNPIHLKLFGIIVKLINHSKNFPHLEALYIKQKLEHNFKLCKLSKKIPLGQCNLMNLNQEILSKSRIRYGDVYDLVLLKELNYNIFHQIAQEKRWTIFLQYNNELYQQTSNVDGTTPVMLMFKYAPLKVIEDYLQQNTQDLVTYNKRNLNILHLVCQNQNLFDKDQQNHLGSFCQKLTELHNFQQLVTQPYELQLPLHIYLDSKFEKSNQFINFLVSYLKVPQLNLNLLRYQADILGQLCKIVGKSLINKQGFASKKIQKAMLIRRKKSKFELNNIIDNEYIQEIMKQFQQAYIYHTQFAKILSKQKNFDNPIFLWINWSWCASYVPYDFSSLDTGFITLFIEEQLERAYSLIEQMKPIEEEDTKLVELVNEIIENHKQNEPKADANGNRDLNINYNPKAQYIKQLLVFMRSLQRQPQEKLMKLIQTRIVDLLKSDQTLLLHPLVGKSVFSQLKVETIYTILYQLQNRELLEQCLILPTAIPKDPPSQFQFLNNIQNLQLNSIIQDPVEQAVFQALPVQATLRYTSQYPCFTVQFSIHNQQTQTIKKQQGEENESEQKDDKDLTVLIPLRNVFKINERIINRFLLKYLTDHELYENQLSFARTKIVISNLLQTLEGFKLLIQTAINKNHLIQYVWNSQASYEKEFLAQDNIKGSEVRISNYSQLDCKRIFEWSKKQIKFNFKYLNFYPNLNDQNIYSKLVLGMVKEKKSFFLSLLLNDEFNKDVEEQVQKDECYYHMLFDASVIIELINARAKKNLSLIIDILDQKNSEEQIFPEILKALSKKYFSQNHLCPLKPDQKSIEAFNSDLSFLLLILDEKSAHVPEVCWIFEQNNQLYYIYPYLTKATFDQIGEKRLTNLIWNTNEQKNCICSKLKDEYLIKFYLDTKLLQVQTKTDANQEQSAANKELYYQQFIDLISPQMLKNQYILKYVYQALNGSQYKCVQKALQRWVKAIFIIDPELVESTILGLNLNSSSLSYMYQLAMRQKRIMMLNAILYYSEDFKVKLDPQLISHPRDADSEYFNYLRALNMPYPLALSLKQYQQFHKDIALYNEHFMVSLYQHHCTLFLLNGQYEKLEFLLKIFKEPNALFDAVIHFLFKILLQQNFKITKNLIELKEQHATNQFDSWKSYGFFDQEESTKQRTRTQQLRSVPTLFTRQQKLSEYIEKNPKIKRQIAINKFNKELDTEIFRMLQSFGKQNSNYSTLFQSSGGQKQNYAKTAQLIDKHLEHKKLTQNQQSVYQLLYNLLFPQNKEIILKQIWKNAIIEQFVDNRKFKCHWIIENWQNYAKTYQINQFINDQLKIERLRFNNQAPLMIEFLLTSNEDKNSIANIFVQNQLRDKRCLEYVTKNFKYLTQLKLNDNTLYYLKNNVNIFKGAPFDLSNIFYFKSRYSKIREHMDVSEFDLKHCTPAQFCLLRGRPTHIQDYKFTTSDIAAAVLSNNFSSIEFVLSKCQNAPKLGIEQNVFQSLVIYMNEQNVIEYFNKYIKPQSLDADRLMFRNNTPILYYVIHKKMFKLFELLYIQYLSYLYGPEKQKQVVLKQLHQKIKADIELQDQISIYQYAILTKFYQVLDIVEMQEEDLQYVQRSLFLFDKVQESQFFPRYNQLIKLYKILSQFNTPLNKKEVKIIKKQDKKIIKYLYVRDQRIDEIIQLEKACLAIVNGCIYKKKFKREILNLLIMHDIEQLQEYKCQPQLVLLFLALHGEKVEEIENDEKFNEAVQIIRQIKKIEPIPNIFDKICQMCSDCKWPNHPIYKMTIKRNPKLFMQPHFKHIVFNELELAVDFVTSNLERGSLTKYLEELKKKYFQFEHTQFDSEDEQQNVYNGYSPEIIRNIIFIMILINSILTNEFDQQFIIENMVSHMQIQNTLNKLKKIKLQDNLQSLSKFNAMLLEIYPELSFKDQDFLEKIPQKFENNLILAFTSLNIILNIKIQTEQLEFDINNRLNLEMEDKFGFLIHFNNKPINLIGNQFEIHLIYDGEHELYILQQSQVEDFIPVYKRQYHLKSVKGIIESAYQEEQDKNSQFDFSSILDIDINSLQNDPVFSQGQELFKKLFFIEDLMKQQQQVGVFSVDDIFAPHQHEQVRPPEMPTLGMQQSSIQQSGMVQSAGMHSQIIRQTSINYQQQMKEDFQFMFELLPDNTYQVRQRKRQGQKELIFVEFYHYIQPPTKVNLIQLTEEEYLNRYCASNAISLIIQDIYRYNQYLEEILTENQSEEWEINFPFYIKNCKFIYQDQLFSSFNIQKLMVKTFQFIEVVKSSLGRSDEISKLQWRVSIASLLEVIVSKLIESGGAGDKIVNIYALMDQVFEWDTLVMILHQIIYNNLVKAQSVLKVIRGVYIEFNEIQQAFAPEQFSQGLDKLFCFGNTQYLLYNHMLIIRLNVGQREVKQIEQQVQQFNKNVFKQDSQIQEYLHNIINEYDFYSQIFVPEQLIQFLFNKLTIDRKLLTFSDEISQILNKTVTLSVDHSGLAKLFSNQILQIKSLPNSQRLKEMEQIWYILLKLNKYFSEDLIDYLKKQLTTDKFEEMFHIRLHSILESLRYQVPISQILEKNEREISMKEKSGVLQSICQFAPKSPELKLQFQFGFQVSKNYYINNSKLGDVCMIYYCENAQKNHIISCQLVMNSKAGSLLFVVLENKDNFLTQEYILRQQAHYQTIMVSDNQNKLISLEDIHSVILFQPTWPSDLSFNQNIVNVFITDARNNIFICNEPKFLEKMNQIQLEQDEVSRQDMLDDTFGIGLLNTYSELSLTSLTPIFPDQINFEFQAPHQLKKQQSSVTSGLSVQVQITGDKFKLSSLELQPISIICYLECTKSYQIRVSEFSKYLKKNKVIKSVKLIFDDNMNSEPEQYLGVLQQNLQIFDIFREALDQFFFDRIGGPKLNQSLQYFFGLQNLRQIKEYYFNQLIKAVQFHFITYVEDDLIQLKDGVLKLFLQDNGTIPEEYQIYQFLSQLILNYKNNALNNIISDQNVQFNITNRYDNDQEKQVIDLIILMKYLATLMLIKCPNPSINICSMFELQSSFSQLKNNFYFFNENEAFILYNNCKDFSLKEFLLNYLNKCQDKCITYQSNTYIGQPIQESQYWENANLQEQFNKVIAGEDIELIQQSRYALLLRKNQDSQYVDCAVVPHIEKDKKLIKYSQQVSHNILIGQKFVILIGGLEATLNLDQQLKKIEITIDEKENSNLSKLISQKNKQMKIIYQMISECVLLLEFYSDKSINLAFSSPYIIQSQPNQQEQHFILNYITEGNQDLSKTVHLKMFLETREVEIQSDQAGVVATAGTGDPKLMKILQKTLKVEQETLPQDFLLQGVEYDKELLKGNTINMLSKQEIQSASRCGQLRKDYIEFKDSLGNTITTFNYESLVLIHNVYQNIQYNPKQIREMKGLILEWEPIFKGVYKLYINQVKIKGSFVVLANEPSVKTSKVEVPKDVGIVPYFEQARFTFVLKDMYENIYGDIEKQNYIVDGECQVESEKQYEKLVKLTFSNVTKFGQQNCTVTFEAEGAETQEQVIQLSLDFKLDNKILINLPIKIQGISLEKRKEKFQKELSQVFRPTSYNLNIRRMNFLQDLLSLVDKKMNYSFSIKFSEEPGIDAGGLKREFYDMIGNTLKDETYKFFSPVPTNLSKYFLNNHFNKLKDKQTYALLFGKLIANSIANNYLIGIDIVPPFWKVVFGEQLAFEDLSYILDESTYKNYQLLRRLDDVDSLCLSFTHERTELIQNGSKMEVTNQNLEQFLQKTAEYLIQKKFAGIFKSFIEGFNMVTDIKIIQKWIHPSEVSLFTQGLSEIKGDIILSKTRYSGGNSQHKAFWETYLMQAEPQMLKNMLKFITGSSTIPFDSSSYIIEVQFRKEMDVRKLPLSHTCFKSIEVPHYTNFNQLKQKLDIAFSIGLEGFGFG